ncbi:MAG TPA: peptidoglycan DD-metalloendopeptidase family protein [Candidatus Dormibacteraeota bacterium]|jgi:murein DD-endopeptidase MepM/ murein hydrolase activator NlpD
MKTRIFAALAIATLSWVQQPAQNVSALYCYPGDPPAVYKACVDYAQGIGQQVNNQNQLQSIEAKINDAVAQIYAISAMINSLNNQIAAQKALIAQTQLTIDDINRQIRFGDAEVTRLVAHISVRDELLNQRLRYIDGHGTVNYVELILTANNFNAMMNRMIAAQQVAASDRKMLNGLAQERADVALANTALDVKRGEVTALIQQQKATQAELEKNVATQAAALAYAKQLEIQLADQQAKLKAERAAIDAQVAQLSLQYQAAAQKAGGGSGVFEWPEPACGASCISQRFGCSYVPLGYDDFSCPWPHKIHTGIDIAGPYGTGIVAADTGVVQLYPNSIGYGNYLVMFHGNGYSTHYGHLSGFAPGLSSGMVVARGTTIAFEGSTGWSTGPHLHFEIRVNGVWKDPCIWLGC